MDPTAAISAPLAPPPSYLPSEGDAPPDDRAGDELQVPGGMVAAAATTGGAPEASGAALVPGCAPRVHPGRRGRRGG
jgi:hypothetical protein